MSDLRDNVYADEKGIPHNIEEKGVTWASPEMIASWGWTLKDKDYQAPVSAETIRKQQYDSINADYVATRDKLLLARMALVAAGSTTTNIDTAISENAAAWKAALLAVS